MTTAPPTRPEDDTLEPPAFLKRPKPPPWVPKPKP